MYTLRALLDYLTSLCYAIRVIIFALTGSKYYPQRRPWRDARLCGNRSSILSINPNPACMWDTRVHGGLLIINNWLKCTSLFSETFSKKSFIFKIVKLFKEKLRRTTGCDKRNYVEFSTLYSFILCTKTYVSYIFNRLTSVYRVSQKLNNQTLSMLARNKKKMLYKHLFY